MQRTCTRKLARQLPQLAHVISQDPAVLFIQFIVPASPRDGYRILTFRLPAPWKWKVACKQSDPDSLFVQSGQYQDKTVPGNTQLFVSVWSVARAIADALHVYPGREQQ
jgi:hypothetical protein